MLCCVVLRCGCGCGVRVDQWPKSDLENVENNKTGREREREVERREVLTFFSYFLKTGGREKGDLLFLQGYKYNCPFTPFDALTWTLWMAQSFRTKVPLGEWLFYFSSFTHGHEAKDKKPFCGSFLSQDLTFCFTCFSLFFSLLTPCVFSAWRMVLNTRSSVSNGADPLGGNVTCTNVSFTLFLLCWACVTLLHFTEKEREKQEKGKRRDKKRKRI